MAGQSRKERSRSVGQIAIAVGNILEGFIDGAYTRQPFRGVLGKVLSACLGLLFHLELPYRALGNVRPS